MAEHTSTATDPRTQRCVKRYTESANNNWPNGLAGLLADYSEGRTDIRGIKRKLGIHYRGLQRLLAAHGVQQHDTKTAIQIARRLKPEWNHNISRAKIAHSFRHSLDVTKTATAKRIATWRADPNRHGLSHAQMNKRELEFAKLLSSHGIEYLFNHHTEGFWVDFYLPGLRLGIEVHRASRRPYKRRDAVLRHALNLRTIIYVPTGFFFKENFKFIESFVLTLTKDLDSLADTVGDAQFLSRRGHCDRVWYGFAFKSLWRYTPTPPP